MRAFYKAMATSLRAGYYHPALGYCEHRHRDRGAAQQCASRQPRKLAPRIYRRWTVAEFIEVRVTRARSTKGRR